MKWRGSFLVRKVQPKQNLVSTYINAAGATYINVVSANKLNKKNYPPENFAIFLEKEIKCDRL